MNGLNVVISGGTGRLGQAVVAAFLDAGAICHIPNFVSAELENCSWTDHANVRIHEGVDLTDEASTEKFYQAVPDLWASVHLAGGFLFCPVGDTSAADFERQWRMNALTCFLTSRYAVDRMRAKSAQRGGRIVNIAARPALEPRTGGGMTAYVAAKSAVAGLTQSLAAELVEDRIFVNAVAPSILDTPENRADMPDADFSAWPKVEEVAQSILYLASPENTLTSGSVLTAYGRV